MLVIDMFGDAVARLWGGTTAFLLGGMGGSVLWKWNIVIWEWKYCAMARCGGEIWRGNMGKSCAGTGGAAKKEKSKKLYV